MTKRLATPGAGFLDRSVGPGCAYSRNALLAIQFQVQGRSLSAGLFRWVVVAPE